MRIIVSCLMVLLVSLSFNADAGLKQLRWVEPKLEELGFRMGDETDKFAEFRLDDRTWVDKRNIIVPGASDRSYLVTFRESCQGTMKHTMRHRLVKNKGYLSKWDKFVTVYEGRNIAWCEVIAVHELEPI